MFIQISFFFLISIHLEFLHFYLFWYTVLIQCYKSISFQIVNFFTCLGFSISHFFYCIISMFSSFPCISASKTEVLTITPRDKIEYSRTAVPCGYYTFFPLCSPRGTRTPTPFKGTDFKSVAYTIPPPDHLKSTLRIFSPLRQDLRLGFRWLIRFYNPRRNKQGNFRASTRGRSEISRLQI